MNSHTQANVQTEGALTNQGGDPRIRGAGEPRMGSREVLDPDRGLETDVELDPEELHLLVLSYWGDCWSFP